MVTTRHELSLRNDAATVWGRVTTPQGIRDELQPILSMTMPPGLRGRSIADAEDLVDRRLGRAWVLLFGLIPVEYDDMTLVEIGESSLREESATGTTRRWVHERTVTPAEHGSVLTDRLTLIPRAAVPPRIARVVVDWLFKHRHRRLERWDRRYQPIG